MTSAMSNEVLVATLPSGALLLIEGSGLGGSEQVAAKLPSLSDVLPVIREFSDQLGATLMASGAKSVTAEFGVSLALESGRFVAMIAKGSASVNLKVSMSFEA
jgi:hypothetical protein